MTNICQAMTPTNPRWEEFISLLTGPQGCNFRYANGRNQWDCKGGHNKEHSIRILQEMGLSQGVIVNSLTYFTANGGHCDCEVVFNVAE